jgi:Fe-S cluster assembly iron-binding protein IscA
VLELTAAAAEAICTLLAAQAVPSGGGLRITVTAPANGDEQPGYEMAVVTGPAASDAVVERDGAFVYLEPAALGTFTDTVLDAHEREGGVSFTFLTRGES